MRRALSDWSETSEATDEEQERMQLHRRGEEEGGGLREVPLIRCLASRSEMLRSAAVARIDFS